MFNHYLEEIMMKRLVNRILATLLVSAMMSVMALAKVKSDNVSFSRDMMVNGKVVKKGTYKVTFDDQTNEMTIYNKKEMVTKTTVRLENRNRKPAKTEVTFTQKENNNVLNTITFVGETQTIVVDAGREQA